MTISFLYQMQRVCNIMQLHYWDILFCVCIYIFVWQCGELWIILHICESPYYIFVRLIISYLWISILHICEFPYYICDAPYYIFVKSHHYGLISILHIYKVASLWLNLHITYLWNRVFMAQSPNYIIAKLRHFDSISIHHICKIASLWLNLHIIYL